MIMIMIMIMIRTATEEEIDTASLQFSPLLLSKPLPPVSLL